MKPEETIVQRFERAQDRLVLQAADLSLETIAAMVDQEAIDIAPQYQRRERWDLEQMSALIESFLLNIPVPPVYLAEDDFGTYSVIDGKQRITAISGFMRNRWSLAGLDTFTSLEGRRLSGLPRALQNALSVRPYIRAVTLLKQSDPDLKYEVFTRLNTGGEPLLPQEIRNVLFRGPLNDELITWAKAPFLLSQLKIASDKSPNYKTMQDVEMVLRFLTLRDSWENFSGDYRRSMDDFMRSNQNAASTELRRYGKSFQRSLDGCEAIWASNAFKRPSGDGWRDQFLAGMYDAQMVAVSQLSEPQLARAIKHHVRARRVTKELFDDAAFEGAVRQATNTPARVRYRIKAVHVALTELGD